MLKGSKTSKAESALTIIRVFLADYLMPEF